jgi:hypothetical protein
MRCAYLAVACGLAFVMSTAGSALAGPASAPNPCKLVTAADAKIALGTTVAKPQLVPVGLYQSCTYSAGKVNLVVLVRRISKSVFVKSAKANPKPVVSVSGIGDSAYSVGGGASLLVWRNGTEAAFSIYGTRNTLTRDEQLARKVVGKL